MIRLFIALPLEPSVEQRLERIIADLKPQAGRIKWVAPKNIHATLRFLGDTEERLVPKLKGEIDAVAGRFSKVTTSLGPIGGFPNLHRPRVIWIGIEKEQETLAGIARDLEHQIRSLGFDKEDKPFKPHLTLARVREPQDIGSLPQFLSNYKFAEIPLLFDRIVLFKSTLTPQGPIYERMHQASLR